jgi:hypothetical protein
MKIMSKYKNILIVSICSFLAGYLLVSPKEKIKEVTKYVTVEVEKKQTKKTTRIKETKGTDGSTTKDTTIVEDSTSETSRDTSFSSERSKDRSKGVSLGLLALKDIDRFSEKTHIGAVVSVPIIGKVSLIGSLDSTQRVGLGVSLEF